ncbi:hypothetical protein [Kitasatospora phosalacinea]|uniref:Uncharacterized protein n=1 Tax=Kitasatospora phosalacinea TaxID=2065 RepID=A0A9W6PM52_9ACTN|nr:hypothetical protein [Kitasatospora phosalacinea]GLW57505.1 hypothetical protein Kpho01_55160 [Kitasatospora phosalacinea]
MGIGGCIILLAVGAILAFGVHWHLAGVNLTVVGVVLMAAGLIGVAVYARVLGRRRYLGGRGVDEVVVEERRRDVL